MKPVKVIRDPEAFKLLADETRKKIIFLLRVKEMTVSQLASELGVTPQAVYHHIKKLQKAKLVEVSREERVGHLIESYYRATAEIFTCSVGGALQSQEFLQEQAITVLNALNEIGFDLELDEEKVRQLVDVQKERNGCCGQEQFMDEISKLEDVDLFTKLIVEKYATLIEMSDDEFQRQQELDRKFRDLLVSLKK